MLGTSNVEVIKQRFTAMLCPSDPNSRENRVSSDSANNATTIGPIALSNYAANVGDHPNGTGSVGSVSYNGTSYVYGNSADAAAKVRGVMSRYGWSANLAEIPDGTSNTYLAGEVIPEWCRWQDWGHQNFATTAWPVNWKNRGFALGSPNLDDHNNSITFRSRHTGGAQFVYCDGSTRFRG